MMEKKAMENRITNAMTVDVEDYFQVSAFERYISRDSWDKLPHRVENNIDLILSLFNDHNIRATFFTLGWVAERHPQMMRRIADAGHEIASHGYEHVRVTNQDRDSFRKDIVDTRRLLEDISGKLVTGYRAASFSINAENHWAHEELELAGYKYSSSIYPIHHDLYGIPGAGRFPYKPGAGNLLEIPISTLEWRGTRFPCGGGGYFRLFPYAVSRYMIRQLNQNEQQPSIFYFHPWELDPAQPRIGGLDLKTRFRHYNNLGRMQAKFSRLLEDFNWGCMQDIFLDSKNLSRPVESLNQITTATT
jgi:polysaccharide deacetylase family protein (PEP-CTERM system associated)